MTKWAVRAPQPPPRASGAPNYKPSKAELEENLRVDATFNEAIQALTQPVKVHYVKYKRKR